MSVDSAVAGLWHSRLKWYASTAAFPSELRPLPQLIGSYKA
jgi:hypothetical protein